jgi:hypothetical protein
MPLKRACARFNVVDFASAISFLDTGICEPQTIH